MRSKQDPIPSYDAHESEACDAGFFTWDVGEDMLYSDGAVARLFGLDPEATESGLGIATYLERVHPDDRPGLAKAIRNTIVEHRPQQEVYRVLNALDESVSVLSFGRCFRNAAGEPCRYVGIIVPNPDPDVQIRARH